VALLEDALLDVTDRDDVILEPFCGSGSMLIAAETTGRRCRAIEMDPLYVDLALRRWRKLTGQEPVHEASGKTFSQIEAERSAEINQSGAASDEEIA
jgi:DNA modification methylase